MSVRAVSAIVVFAAVTVLGLFRGGYAPTAWGWTALLLLWATTLALAFRTDLLVDANVLALLAAAIALVGWTTLSVVWSESVPRTMFEVERDLVYIAGLAAVAVGARLLSAQAIVVGISAGLAAIVVYGLGATIVSAPTPDATQGYLLSRPVGYANAVGGVAALAFLPLLALATYASRRAVRAASGAALVVLASGLYLTQNRSAWLALGLALVVWVLRTREPGAAIAPSMVLACPCATAVAVIAALDLLDTGSSSPHIHAHRLLAGAVVVAAGLAAAALAALVRPSAVPQKLAVRGAYAAGVLVLAALAASFTRLGDRAHYWRVAWRAFFHHPVIGTGAGTFDLQWFRYRDIARTVRDAHNLYLGTLGELGGVGAVLLVVMLALPVVYARHQRDPLLTAGLASYCGFLLHTSFEWDWRFPVVAGSALLLGATLMVSDVSVRLSARRRLTGIAIALAASLFVVAALAGNSAVTSAESRMVAGDASGAATRADRARRLLPWSSEPWLVLADSRLQLGDVKGARAAAREALRRDPNDWAVWVRLASITHGAERTAAIRRALALDPLLTSGH